MILRVYIILLYVLKTVLKKSYGKCKCTVTLFEAALTTWYSKFLFHYSLA